MSSRRDFLRGSLGGAAGFSLFVDARAFGIPDRIRDAVPPASPGSLGLDGRRDRLPIGGESSATLAGDPHMRVVDHEVDLLVAGGGMAGVCAAISAARNGARTLLVQDRSRLGGNASSEIRMHIVGADCHGSRRGWREGGLIEEIRLDDAARNPDRVYEMFDLLLYDKCVSEPNLDLLLDTAVARAGVEDGRITEVLARCEKTETIHRIRPRFAVDATGDSRLALESGAALMRGREAKSTFGESLGLDVADRKSQGSSILFTARDHGRPMPYVAPTWARRIDESHLKHRGIGSWEYGYWWIELGGEIDTIADNERLRFELLGIVLGVWDHIKNSGRFPKSETWALETVGMIPGKRESRRILGHHVQTQSDLEGGWKQRDDGVSIGGWNFDDHPPEGFDAPDKRPFTSVKIPEVYNIAFDALRSRDVSNLLMAGRNISNSHVAFTSTRVMATCACTGQAVGTAAAFCVERGIDLERLRADREVFEGYRQRLLRDDQSIRGVANADPDDLARMATVTASAVHEDAVPEHVVNGLVRDMPGAWSNRWGAPVRDDGEPQWIAFEWDAPRSVSLVQITHDTGFHRELTLSASDWVTRGMQRGPQVETLRDYDIERRRRGGDWETVAEIRGNHQRLRRHRLDAAEVDGLRVVCRATNGSPQFRIYEVRCYA